MYILQYINLNFQKLFLEVNILYAVFVKYALPNASGHLISMQSALTYFQSGSA